MYSQALSKIFLVLILNLLQGAVAHASEAKSEEPEAAEAAPVEEVSESQKKQINEAVELQGKVQALQAKVRTKTESINKLIEEKNHTKDPQRVKEIIAEMVTEHREMGKLIEEYEQNRSLLRYRYPEKGYSGSRNYERMEAKPLDQMENQMSVEAKLKRNLKTVRSQFVEPPGGKNAKKKKADKKKAAEAPLLTDPIVIQK